MKEESKDRVTRKLLGYFMVEDCSGGCLIVDWLYSVESLYYTSEDENRPQIIIPRNHCGILWLVSKIWRYWRGK